MLGKLELSTNTINIEFYMATFSAWIKINKITNITFTHSVTQTQTQSPTQQYTHTLTQHTTRRLSLSFDSIRFDSTRHDHHSPVLDLHYSLYRDS